MTPNASDNRDYRNARRKLRSHGWRIIRVNPFIGTVFERIGKNGKRYLVLLDNQGSICQMTQWRV